MASSIRPRIVIGVDFGTTFSAVAWAVGAVNSPEIVHVIREWPQHAGGKTRAEKVPTKLRLRPLRNNDPEWGFLIPTDAPNDEVLQWFKLKLDDRPKVAAFIPENIRDYSGRRIDQAIVDYLSSLGTEVMHTLTDGLSAGIIADYELKYVLTVPAIWSERATQRTRSAFQEAMNIRSAVDITVISEPEAAAICELQEAETRIVDEGECIMILDAGGGTVDLISYAVRQLHPLIVDEAVAGSGDVCGGATVTSRFESWLLPKIRDLEFFDDDVLRAAVDSFDTRIKPIVNSARLASNQRFYVPVPGLSDNQQAGISNELLMVSAFDIVSFFQPCIERIKLLVAEQIAASNVPITAIIMVGGFGQRQYLKEELEQDTLIRERNIKICKSCRARTAVVQGAVMKGLYESAPQDSTRIRIGKYKARKHYGTELTVTYSDLIHSEVFNKRRWDGLNGCYEVEVMDWFIKKVRRSCLRIANVFKFRNFTVTSKVNHGKPRRLYLIIYTDETSQVAPLSKTENVRELCAVDADLSLIPESQMVKRRGTDGFMYFSTDGEIEIVYRAQTIRFTLIYKGVRYNSVNVDFF
ncbi:hypothetical protein KVR01_006086 [Diaporthe batatas]|uniref:uncharacterized protein n=1 Tax=Diaporthe batatas TaxID=748121 RepID=UPI001D0438F1|nr:uncharacterized protein KVR01_006086 [Diaporthe batatas]KAG8164168.1 hypothetical protein KVR01_006086 [Diaporthe batatas]